MTLIIHHKVNPDSQWDKVQQAKNLQYGFMVQGCAAFVPVCVDYRF